MPPLSFDEQMVYVEKYFKERGFKSSKKRNVADLYTAVTGYGYKKVVGLMSLIKYGIQTKMAILQKVKWCKTRILKSIKEIISPLI